MDRDDTVITQALKVMGVHTKLRGDDNKELDEVRSQASFGFMHILWTAIVGL